MVEPKEELPIAEEPKPLAKEEPGINTDGLLAELRNAGVENTAQLQGKLDASAQAGKAFQMLGDERKRSETLQAEVDKLKAQPREFNPDSYGEGQPVDIEAAMDRSVDKAFTKREQAQRQAQQASIQAYTAITTHPKYKLVKEIWEEKVKDPGYIYRVQMGEVNPINDFHETLHEYNDTLHLKSSETITKLVGDGTGKAVVPHVESGESHSPNLVSEGKGVSANRQFLDAIRKKVHTEGYVASEEEEAMIAVAVLEEQNE